MTEITKQISFSMAHCPLLLQPRGRGAGAEAELQAGGQRMKLQAAIRKAGIVSAAVFFLTGSSLLAQSRTDQPSTIPRPSSTIDNPISRLPNGTASIQDDPEDAVVHFRRDEARKVERRKRMVDTANRLLALTQALKTDMQGRDATPADEKRLDEIAKLARSVKDQMRD